MQCNELRDFLDSCIRDAEDMKRSFRKQAIELNANFHNEVDRRIGHLKGDFEMRLSGLEQNNDKLMSYSPEGGGQLTDRIMKLEEKLDMSMVNLEELLGSDIISVMTSSTKSQLHAAHSTIQLTDRIVKLEEKEAFASTLTDRILKLEEKYEQSMTNLEETLGTVFQVNELCRAQAGLSERTSHIELKLQSLEEVVTTVPKVTELCREQTGLSERVSQVELKTQSVGEVLGTVSQVPELCRAQTDLLERVCHIELKTQNVEEVHATASQVPELRGAQTDLSERVSHIELKAQKVEEALATASQVTGLCTAQTDLAERVSHIELKAQTIAKLEASLDDTDSQTNDLVKGVEALKRDLFSVQTVATNVKDLQKRLVQVEEDHAKVEGKNREADLVVLTEELRTKVAKDTKQYVADALADSLGQLQEQLRVEQCSFMSELEMNNNVFAEHLVEQLNCRLSDDMAGYNAAEELAQRSRDAHKALHELTALMHIQEPLCDSPEGNLSLQSDLECEADNSWAQSVEMGDPPDSQALDASDTGKSESKQKAAPPRSVSSVGGSGSAPLGGEKTLPGFSWSKDQPNPEDLETTPDAKCAFENPTPVSGSVVHALSPRSTSSNTTILQQQSFQDNVNSGKSIDRVPSACMTPTTPFDQQANGLCIHLLSPRVGAGASPQQSKQQPQPSQPQVAGSATPQAPLQPQQSKQQLLQQQQQPSPATMSRQSQQPQQQVLARAISPPRSFQGGGGMVQGGGSKTHGQVHSSPVLMNALPKASGQVMEVGRTPGPQPSWRSDVARSPLRLPVAAPSVNR